MLALGLVFAPETKKVSSTVSGNKLA